MNLELNLNKRIMKCLVWSVVLYAAETWMLTPTDQTSLKWIWRRMEKSAALIKLLIMKFSEV